MGVLACCISALVTLNSATIVTITCACCDMQHCQKDPNHVRPYSGIFDGKSFPVQQEMFHLGPLYTIILMESLCFICGKAVPLKECQGYLAKGIENNWVRNKGSQLQCYLILKATLRKWKHKCIINAIQQPSLHNYCKLWNSNGIWFCLRKERLCTIARSTTNFSCGFGFPTPCAVSDTRVFAAVFPSHAL